MHGSPTCYLNVKQANDQIEEPARKFFVYCIRNENYLQLMSEEKIKKMH
jgi:hypothetical protein